MAVLPPFPKTISGFKILAVSFKLVVPEEVPNS